MGVIAGSLLSLFLPALPLFFTIIFLLGLLITVLYRHFVIAGLFSFIICWHWQLNSYLLAQEQVLSASQAYFTLEVAAWQRTRSGESLVHFTLREGEAKGYRLQIRWRDAQQIVVGQHWRLHLRLTEPVGLANPGIRQREIQALLAGTVATGYVTPEQPAILLRDADDKRQKIIQQILNWTEDLTTAPLLLALTVGERHFSPSLWQGIQHSGLGHILTISGLHIGLVFGWGYFISGLLLRNQSLVRRNLWQLLVGMTSGLAYAWLAGFAIPTIRAASALLIVIFGRLLLKPINGRSAWQFLVALLLLINPFWVLSYSFWLSVLAVAVIFFLIWWLPPMPQQFRAKVVYTLIFHFFLTLMMSLIGMAFFQGFSFLALLSNLLFVTWCSLIAIPLLLFTLCWSLFSFPFTNYLWQLSHQVFLPLWHWLSWSSELDVWWSVPQLDAFRTFLLAAALLTVLALRVAWQGLFLVTIILLLNVFIPAYRGQQLLLLNSGQSTILLVQQPSLSWLYLDAPGAQLEGLVQHLLLQQLRYNRINQLAFIIIPDLTADMYSAITHLKHSYPQLQIYSAKAHAGTSQSCANLQNDFPASGILHWQLPKNDPCLVSFELAGWRILLPGKIRQQQEHLARNRYAELNADIYLLADYGRPSANSLEWLAHISPLMLILSANAQGAHQYPLARVQQRIALLGLPLYHAGEQGALTFMFEEERVKIRAERRQQSVSWLEKSVN